VRAIIIIISLAILLGVSDTSGNGLFSFLFVEEVKEKVDIHTTKTSSADITLRDRDKMPSYCPDMKKDSYTDKEEWKQLSSERKNNCLAAKGAKGVRRDMSKDIYA